MQPLFVRRDPVLLVEQEGTVEAVKELPEFLRKQPLLIHPFYFDWQISWFDRELFWDEDSRLARLEYNSRGITQSYYTDHPERPTEGAPALWSGYRSCLTKDQQTGDLFRLKGVAFGTKPSWNAKDQRVEGGQFSRNANFERIYSNRFNRVLEEEGLEPVMEFVGMYTFPSRIQRKKVAASIIRVKGDTRLDELFDLIEYLGRIYIGENFEHSFWQEAAAWYTEIGQAIGALKQFMDKNEQTWSDNSQRTNAHIGNVVVYENDTGDLAVGLVDFDASCDLRDKTRADLQAQQRAEYETLIKSALWDGTYRFTGKFAYRKKKAVRPLRRAFVSGFASGYETAPKEDCSIISKERFQDIRAQLQTAMHPVFESLEQILGLCKESGLKDYNRHLFHALKRNRGRIDCLRQTDRETDVVLLLNSLMQRSVGYSFDELISDTLLPSFDESNPLRVTTLK